MLESYQQEFSKKLVKELLSNRKNNYEDNLSLDIDEYNTIKYESEEYDNNIFTVFLKNRSLFKTISKLKKVLIFNIYPQYYYKQYVKKFSEIGLLYQSLSDDNSKKLLLELCAFRIFGHKRVKLSRNNPLYWERLEKIKQYAEKEGGVKIKFMDAFLKVFNLKKLGFNLKVYAT